MWGKSSNHLFPEGVPSEVHVNGYKQPLTALTPSSPLGRCSARWPSASLCTSWTDTTTGPWSPHTGSLRVERPASSWSCWNTPPCRSACWFAGCSASGPGSVTSGERGGGGNVLYFNDMRAAMRPTTGLVRGYLIQLYYFCTEHLTRRQHSDNVQSIFTIRCIIKSELQRLA